MSNEAKKYIKKFPNGHIFAPNSIRHGQEIQSNMNGDHTINYFIEKERQRDFIDYIFKHHIDYMTIQEAWNEFNEYEVDNFILNSEDDE